MVDQSVAAEEENGVGTPYIPPRNQLVWPPTYRGVRCCPSSCLPSVGRSGRKQQCALPHGAFSFSDLTRLRNFVAALFRERCVHQQVNGRYGPIAGHEAFAEIAQKIVVAHL